jgi:hypothetical protein
MFPALGSHLTRHKYWTCCDQHCTADPCSGSDFHDPHDESLEELTRHHQLHYTPVQRYDTGAVQTASNGLVNGPDIRAAVAVDCEMGTAESGDTELIRVTLIDYFTGEILVNNIVEPDVPLRHLNTKYSGVTWGHMREAQRKRTSLKATPGARNAIWRYVGAQTIVVGHGVSNDLRSMKWIHEHVVDSRNARRRKRKKQKTKQLRRPRLMELTWSLSKKRLCPAKVRMSRQRRQRRGREETCRSRPWLIGVWVERSSSVRVQRAMILWKMRLRRETWFIGISTIQVPSKAVQC